MPLTCPECSRDGFKRLTRHMSQVHGMTRHDVIAQYPGIVLEEIAEGVARCSTCHEEVQGYSGRAANVKCERCRLTPATRRRGVDSDTTLACRICGLQRRRLDKHVSTAHGLTTTAYLEKFPDALVDVPGSRARSPECREKQAAAARRRWESEAEREAQSERLKVSAPWKGKHLSEAHRVAIGAGGRGVPHEITAEDRAARGKRGAEQLALVRVRPGYSAKLAAGVARRIARGEILGWQTPESRAKSLASRIRNGTLTPQGAGRGICGFRKGLSHYCRSTLEANFARILLLEGIPYEYEPRVVRLASGSHYTPDFRLTRPLGDMVPAGWVELKGWRKKDGSLPDGVEKKVLGFEQATGERVFVLTMHDPAWHALEAEYALKIELWETPARNLRSAPNVFGRGS